MSFYYPDRPIGLTMGSLEMLLAKIPISASRKGFAEMLLKMAGLFCL